MATPPTSVIDRGPFRVSIYMRSDEGYLAEDGEFTREYPEGAMTWTNRVDADPDAGYVFVFFEGAAEPGDAGCSEDLEVPAGTFGRATFDEGSLDFEPVEEGRMLETLKDFPRPTETLWELLDVDPRLETDADGNTVEVAELDEFQTQLARAELPNLGGINTDYQSARLETLRNDRGEIVETRFTAHYEGEARAFGDGTVQTRVETLTLIYGIDELPRTADRITVDTPILHEGGCTPPTKELVGTWSLLAFVGGDALPAPLFDQVDDAFITIGTDGSLQGSFGCRTFTGSGVIEFASVEAVSLEVVGEPCVAGQFEEDEFEDGLVQVFSSDFGVTIDLEDRLFVYPVNGDIGGVIVFYRTE